MAKTTSLFPLAFEKQCAGFDQAKRLKELGIIQESIGCWTGDPNPDPKYHEPYKLYYTQECYSEQGADWYNNRIAAWTVAELFIMLPINVSVSKGGKQWHCRIWSGDIKDLLRDSGPVTNHHTSSSDKLALCMAEMLLYLLDNGLTDKNGVNERLRLSGIAE